MYAKILSLMTVVVFAAACGGSNKPAENADHRTTGEKVDDAAEKAEDKAEEATEKAGEAAEKAGDKAKAKTKDGE